MGSRGALLTVVGMAQGVFVFRQPGGLSEGCSSTDSLHWDGSKGTLVLMAHGRIG